MDLSKLFNFKKKSEQTYSGDSLPKEVSENIPMAKYYGDLAFNMLTQGQTEVPQELSNVSIQLGYNMVITKHYFNYYIQISSFDTTIIPNVLSNIRDRLKVMNVENVQVDLISRATPHRIKWRSTSMKNNVLLWKHIKKNNKKISEATEDEGYSDTLDDLNIDWSNRREASWQYFKQCEKNKIPIALVSYVYRIRIPRTSKQVNFKLLLENLQDTFTIFGLHPKLLNTCMYDYLCEISPFSHAKTGLAKQMIADRVLSTIVTSQISPLTQNKLNSGNIIIGNDIKNRHGVYIDTHPKSGGSSNITIVSSTGGGKSVLAKSIDEQVLANNDYLYIVDYEGTEYTALGEEYGATFLDFNGLDGKYYEPLRFATLTGIPEIDNDILKNALNAVYMIMDILLKHPMTATQKKLINFALTEYTEAHRVKFKDKKTWKYSLELSIKGLLPRIKGYRCSKTMIEHYGHDLIELCDTLENYFEGPESYMFSNPISFEELREKRLIIVRFGGDTKEELTGEEPIDTQIKQLTIMLLMQELARYRRTFNQSFVIKIEELQRYLKHKGAIPWVNTMYTGVRKCNGSMLGIINDPEKLQGNLSALINSSEYVIVGKNKDLNALKYLFNTPALMGCEKLVESLETIDHGFLIKDKGNMCSIFRTELPMSCLQSPIYRSRTDAVI